MLHGLAVLLVAVAPGLSAPESRGVPSARVRAPLLRQLSLRPAGEGLRPPCRNWNSLRLLAENRFGSLHLIGGHDSIDASTGCNVQPSFLVTPITSAGVGIEWQFAGTPLSLYVAASPSVAMVERDEAPYGLQLMGGLRIRLGPNPLRSGLR